MRGLTPDRRRGRRADRFATVMTQNAERTGGGARAGSHPLLVALDSQSDDSPPVTNAASGGRERLVVAGLLDGQLVSAEGLAAAAAVVGRDLLHRGAQGEDSCFGLGHALDSCPAIVRIRRTSRRNADGSPALSSGSTW